MNFKDDSGCLKSLLFGRDEVGFFSILPNQSKISLTRSRLFDVFDFQEHGDGFFTLKSHEGLLISLRNGNVRFNSQNLGEWELFEQVDI